MRLESLQKLDLKEEFLAKTVFWAAMASPWIVSGVLETPGGARFFSDSF
jgi:hypothetical protein